MLSKPDDPRMPYHIPVMVAEIVEGLVVDPEGIYVDGTAGGGGHCRALLQVLGDAARLVAIDQDQDSITEINRTLGQDRRLTVLQANFADMPDALASLEIGRVNGILLDLGVSSHQIDTAERGFSYQQEGPLDMRMDSGTKGAAAHLLNQAPEQELVQMIKQYGEERGARKIARAICRSRRERPLETTGDLRRVVATTNPQLLNKTLARVFQALRIAVNDELDKLEKVLEAATEMILPGGRFAVLAYHSLEDRRVKKGFADMIRGCICPPQLPVCACGQKPSFSSVHRKAVRSSDKEVERNQRARSAVLRIYERLA